MAILLALLIIVGPAQDPAPPQVSSGVPSPAAAFVGRIVERTEVFIEGRPVADPVLLGLIETRPGVPLAMATVRETIAHISSLGRFQQVFVEATDSGTGVALRFNLIPVQNVERIEFRGELAFGRGTLRRAVTDRFGATPPAARAANVAEMLQGYYFDRGYLAAAVRPVIEQREDRDETVLTFEIRAGTRAVIRNVDISGDPGEPRATFLRRLGAGPTHPYERIEIQRRLTDYIERLRRQGRYEAEGSHRLERVVDDGRAVDISIAISPGPQIAIRYEGDPLPKDRLEEFVPVRREGSIDRDIIEDSEARIVAYLNQQGYWRAAVTTERRELDGRVELVFTVRRGVLYRIDTGPQLSGNASIPTEELRPALRSLQAGELFSVASLDAASAEIRGIYLRRGYGQVKVETAPNEVASDKPGEGRIRPAIVISEGPLLTVGEITFSGNDGIPDAQLLRRLTIERGRPFFEPQVIQSRENLLTEYLNRGFSAATVTVKPDIVDGSRVDLVFTIDEGPQSLVDHVFVVGNVRTDTRVIEREIQLKPGEPLGLDALFETRRRLAALGLFRRVRITDIAHGESNNRDIVVTVEEAPSTTLGYGGGLEISERLGTSVGGDAEEQFEVAPRGFFEIGRRNLGGRNRSANLYTRVSLRSDTVEGGRKTFGFAEYRVVGTYREPRTFGWNADVTVTAAVEQGVRSTFNFARKGVNADIQRRLSAQIRTAGRFTFNTTRRFDERLTEDQQATIDRIFDQVRLAVFSGSIARDTRDDVLDPSRGLFLSGEGSTAVRALGGEVGFIKSYVQAHAYRRLPGPRRVIFASRVVVGLADGFPRQVRTEDPDGTVREETIEDLPASERFFAGGDTTIRGFPLDSVGTSRTITENGFPRGGNGLVVLNAELRLPVWRQVGAALFVDGGNVFERVTQIDFGELRSAVGVGVRYRSPIGPVRFDIGFKLGDLQFRERSRYALHFSFGQAF